MPPEQKAPTYDALMWPALIAMKELGGSATHEELLDKIVELEKIPETVQNIMHTPRQTKISYNLAWAKTFLGKAGALENPSRGVWAITEKGKSLTKDAVKQIPATSESNTNLRKKRNRRAPKKRNTQSQKQRIGKMSCWWS
jgi:restriction system protein